MIGKTLLHYEVTARIGAGGMGEVYQANDAKLGREVAIKVLPAEVAKSEERLARFRREARLLAALSHPGIASIYGLEEADGLPFLVMELAPGEDLKQRLDRGPIPVEESIEIATQIAEALRQAHAQGIVHRDLKPANVKVREDGTVKVLDFGLAKALEPIGAGSSPEESHSPTLTSPAMSQTGVILGTAAYMSPEQARGKAVDQRADVWAFGAVVYEMLTGRRAFPGDDLTDTLAAVVRAEPAWEALPASLSPTLRVFLARCLHKDPNERIHDIADMRLALEGAFETTLAPSNGGSGHHFTKPRITLAAGAAAVALLGSFLVGRATLPDPAEAPKGQTRFSVDLASGQRLSANSDLEARPAGYQRPSARSFVLSPDGRDLVYLASDGATTRLFRRPLGRTEAAPIPNTEGAQSPFFSPDGEEVAFFVGADLKRVSLGTGEVRTATLSGTTSEWWFWPSWSSRDTIVLGSLDGIYEVPASGGRVSRLTKSESSEGPPLAYPQLLPGNRALLFNVIDSDTPSEWNVVVESLETGQRHVVIEGGSDPRYVSSGHILFVRTGKLMAVPFDTARLEVDGAPIVVVEDVMQAERGAHPLLNSGAGQFSVSRSGVLAYVPGGIYPVPTTSLVWVDRAGASEALPLPPGRRYCCPRFSPDGRQLLYTRGREGDNQIWVYDIELETPTRLTTAGSNWWPVWSPDGQRVIFSAGNERSGQQMYVMALDGSGEPQQLGPTDAAWQFSSSCSREGVLAFLQSQGVLRNDIWTVPLDGGRAAAAFLETPFDERWPAFSPDGRWLAYASNETGRFEVYVRPFPAGAPVHRVSTDGGGAPLWSPDGEQLYFRIAGEGDDFTRGLMVVDVTPGTTFTRTQPRVLFDSRELDWDWPLRGYDVAPDGQRFAMTTTPADEPEPVTRIQFVLNWFEELNERVPVN